MAHKKTSDPQGRSAQIDWQAELARHNGWLRCVVYSRVGEQEAVDEVMQEIALAVVRGSAPLNDPNKIGPWLYRLAATQSLLYRRTMGRRRKLKQRYASRFQPTEVDQQTPDPLDWLLADERRVQIREALASLNAKDAELLLMKYVDNLSYKRMAELLGKSTSAIESRLHRARSRLRQSLSAMEVVETRS